MDLGDIVKHFQQRRDAIDDVRDSLSYSFSRLRRHGELQGRRKALYARDISLNHTETVPCHRTSSRHGGTTVDDVRTSLVEKLDTATACILLKAGVSGVE